MPAAFLLLPRRPQVQVILQQLPLHLPPPLSEQFLELARGQPGRIRGLQLFGQRREQAHLRHEGCALILRHFPQPG
jgi:hypothetical protein